MRSAHGHGGGVYPAATVLAEALPRFVAVFPGVVARVMMRDRDKLLRRLRAREIEYFVAEFSTFGNANDLHVSGSQADHQERGAQNAK